LAERTVEDGSKLWRASLYEADEVVSVEYDTSRFPDEGSWRITAAPERRLREPESALALTASAASAFKDAASPHLARADAVLRGLHSKRI
jgi:hypothetical protein